MRAAVLLLAVAMVAPATAASPPPSPTATPGGGHGASVPGAHIDAVYPNPVAAGDNGEFVVVVLPPAGSHDGLVLTDGEASARLPSSHPAGRVAVATTPAARRLTDLPVVLVDAPLRLSNDGERVALLEAGVTLDAVTYPRAPEGEAYRRTGAGWEWQPLGSTAFPVRTASDATVRLFVFPDAPGAALEPLRGAERRLWLAGYTLTDARVADALCAARRRGVDVRVLVELEPVAGMTATGARRLDRLAGCGVAVRAIGGPHARYAFHHAKYAVVDDDRAVVLTENWKPGGVGGRASRGWGVAVESPAVAASLAETFAADAGWRDARPWADARADRAFDRTEPPANGSFARVFTPVRVDGVGVEVVVAPDNAERRTVALLDAARATVKVVQVSVGGPDQPFVRALVRAARRGVEVELLLADAWYVRDHNREVADALRGRARDEGLPLRVRLARPRGRYERIHAKGVVVDGEHVLIGSLNWNNASARRNREVALVLHGRAAGRFYERVFAADWQGGRWRVPAGLLAAAAVLALAAAAFGRRHIVFESRADAVVEPGQRGPEDGEPRRLY